MNISTFTCTFKGSSLSVSSDCLHWETFSALQQGWGQTLRRSTVHVATEHSAKHRKVTHWCAECVPAPATELPRLFLLSLTLLPSVPSWERESWLKLKQKEHLSRQQDVRPWPVDTLLPKKQHVPMSLPVHFSLIFLFTNKKQWHAITVTLTY